MSRCRLQKEVLKGTGGMLQAVPLSPSRDL